MLDRNTIVTTVNLLVGLASVGTCQPIDAKGQLRASDRTETVVLPSARHQCTRLLIAVVLI